MTPIFIFSLPRSGSTLLQRFLATSDDVATVSEPWLLIPWVYALRGTGVYAEYGHYHLSVAMEEFCGCLPNGKDDYYEALRDMASQLYNKVAGGKARYFLDKTPRYHLICKEIARIFPDAKFIFLWRNPLAVIASMIESSAPDKHWNLFHYKVDLFDGLRNLLDARKKMEGRAIDVSYESLILHPDEVSAEICDYLDIECLPGSFHDFGKIKLQGTMGDPTGIIQYDEINPEPLNKWKNVIVNPLRKAWCAHYLKKIGKNCLSDMGYDLDRMLLELREIPGKFQHIPSDIIYMIYGGVFSLFEPYLMKHKISVLGRGGSIHAHT